ncbi:MAG: hypothetical protein ACFFAO_06630 [Candidatus Hermodarchaeota archaeon]
MILLTNNSLSDSAYLDITINITIITTALSPISVLCWLVAITYFLDIKRAKLILLIAVILLTIFEILFFYFYTIDLSYIGVFNKPFDYTWSLLTSIYYLSVIALITITGILFAKESLKIDDPELQLKGKLILVALLSFIIGALLPYIIYTVISLIIARIILVSASIEFYMGFILPNWTKRRFLKE